MSSAFVFSSCSSSKPQWILGNEIHLRIILLIALCIMFLFNDFFRKFLLIRNGVIKRYRQLFLISGTNISRSSHLFQKFICSREFADSSTNVGFHFPTFMKKQYHSARVDWALERRWKGVAAKAPEDVSRWEKPWHEWEWRGVRGRMSEEEW